MHVAKVVTLVDTKALKALFSFLVLVQWIAKLRQNIRYQYTLLIV